MMEELLRGGLAELGAAAPSATQLCQLRRYYELLAEKNTVMNLTAITEETEVARLHFLDCAALLPLTEFRGKRVIDVGTGAGFPGLPLKILEPTAELTLLDSLRKRVDFLQLVCDALALPDVTCLHARAEEAAVQLRGGFDLAVSRAVARLNVLCELCLPFVAVGGTFLAMKGPDCAEELREAENAIALLGGTVAETHGYVIPGTDVRHSVVVIRKTGETPLKYPRRFAKIQKQPL
jgi:16S rRNA (guanine527-N7)-methyltransferase